MVKRIYILLIILFSLIGIVLSGMLTVAKYNKNIAAICGEEETNSCNIVQNSDYATIFEITNNKGDTAFQLPLSLAGMFFYITLLILSVILLTYFKTTKDLKKLKYFMFIVGLIGIIFSIILTWIQAYKIEAFCQFCLISAMNSLIIFVLLVIIVFSETFQNRKKDKNAI